MPHGLAIWSKNAGSNQTIDDNAYLQEGQAAPTLNNAIRGAMASVAEWRDDNFGVLAATRGLSETYAVSPNQVIPDLTQPFTLGFTVDALNQAPAKLAVGGLTAKAIKRKFGRDLGPGDLSPNVFYRVQWVPSLDYFIVISPEIEKPGKIEHLAHAAAPDPGWLKCYGQAVSRTAYAALFAVVGTTWGAGDGTTTFNLPDYAGRTLFGADDMSGTLAGRISAAVGGLPGTIASVGGTQGVTLSIAQLPVHSFTATMDAQGGHSHTFSGTTSGQSNDHTHGVALTTDTQGNHSHSYITAADHNYLINAGTGSFLGVWGSSDQSVSTTASGAHAHNVNGNTAGVSANHTHTYSGTTAAVGAHSHAITVSSIGSGASHANIPPAAVVTIVIKA